ncbi:hypothetical protein [Streptomyces sp. NRRL S-337]|uniref:hypothetical protein n=1 Tax=Streptomyces sp. NRRL S-337 TaxID=1463900 RepID=UPI000ACF2C37|nr:hypothetical protein [Streptomyces sp. NRRL S-337]
MADTFGDRYHRRRTDDGRAHTARAAQDRATYDQDPDGDGCAAPALVVLTTTITAILGALLS